MKEFGLFINGRFEAAEGGKTMETVNPATEEPWAKVGRASKKDVHRAIAAAKKSFDSGVWRSKSKEERAKVLESVAAAIMERGEELAAAEAQDGGGTIRKASFMDVPGAAGTFQQFAKVLRESVEEEVYEENVPVPSKNIIRAEPIGVCAGITPWNFPMIMASWKIAPAIAAGNSVVIKPASVTTIGAYDSVRYLERIPYKTYLPIVLRGYTVAPDLVVSSLTATGSGVWKRFHFTRFSATCHSVHPTAIRSAAVPSRFQPTRKPASMNPSATNPICTPSGCVALGGRPSRAK